MSSTIQSPPFKQDSFSTVGTLDASPILRAKVPVPPIHQPIRVLQGLAILMVVFAHSVIPGEHFSGWAEVADRFVRACTVPLFICMSGFLYRLSNSTSRPYVRQIREKVYRLLLPYVVLSSVAFLVKASLGRMASRPLPLTWTAYSHQLLYPWDNAIIFFWFLPTLFFIFTISIAVDKLVLSKRPALLPVLLIIFAIAGACIGIRQADYPVRVLNLYGALNYLINFWTGYALCRYESMVVTYLARWWRALALLAFVVTLTVAIPDANYAIAVIEGVFASVALFSLATLLCKKIQLKPLSTIGDNSYQIYLLSWFFQTMPIIVLSRLISRDPFVCFAASSSLGVCGPLAVAYIVRKWLPVLRPLVGIRATRRPQLRAA